MAVAVLTASFSGAFAASSRPASQRLTVPDAVSRDMFASYERLHRAGLRVRLSASFSAGTLPSSCSPRIATQRPRAGQPTRFGSVVTLGLRPQFCLVGSPGVPTGKLPSAIVPDFIGKRVSVAVAWADRHDLYSEEDDLPALHAGAAAHLLDNYRVVGQQPAPGSLLSLGVGHRSGNTGSFLPTPLVLYGRLEGHPSSRP